MIRIKPFNALMPRPEQALKVACPPYDVMNRQEAAVHASGNPLCFLRVTRAEIDLPPDIDPYSDAVYERAAARFAEMKRAGALERDSSDGLYVYRMEVDAHSQSGIVACCNVEDYRHGAIKRHEFTRFEKENDRARHIESVRAHTGPVLLAYPDSSAIAAITARAEKERPLFDFVSAGDVRHTIWRAPDPEELAREFVGVSAAYIADGHHRAAASLRAADLLRGSQAGSRGDRESDWFLAILFPADSLRVLPYNRCVSDLNGLTPDRFMAAVKSVFRVTGGAWPSPPEPGNAAMFFEGKWFGLQWEAPASADPVSRLDVSVLQDRLLGPVLGIGDPRSSPRIEFIGGSRGTDELEKRVRSGGAAAAFSMYPTTVRCIMEVADAGKTMPPKSTWFDPKPMSGLLIHDLDAS